MSNRKAYSVFQYQVFSIKFITFSIYNSAFRIYYFTTFLPIL